MVTKVEKSKRPSPGDRIISGLEEAVQMVESGKLDQALASGAGNSARGGPITVREIEVTPPPEFRPADVVTLRERTGLSQTAFAKAISASPGSVQKWEQGVKLNIRPSTRRLFQIIELDPIGFVATVSNRRHLAKSEAGNQESR